MATAPTDRLLTAPAPAAQEEAPLADALLEPPAAAAQEEAPLVAAAVGIRRSHEPGTLILRRRTTRPSTTSSTTPGCARSSARSPTSRSPASRSATSRRCSATPRAFRRAVDELADRFGDVEVDRVVGIEARGFILAAPVAYRLGASFVPVRKAGKLPWAVVREEYQLEYGADKLEIHRDAIHPDERILVDRRRAGHRAARRRRPPASSRRSAARIVGVGVLIELAALGGRAALGDRRLEALASY